MQTDTLFPTTETPAVVYYCKAGIATGLVVRVEYLRQKYACKGCDMKGADADLMHDDQAKKKRGGARCVLVVRGGILRLYDAKLLT